MAITVTIEKHDVHGSERVHSGTLTMGTYLAGGIAFAAGDFGLGTLRQLDLQAPAFEGTAGAATAVMPVVDYVASKIWLFDLDDGAQHGNGATTGLTLRWIARGR